MAKILCAGKLPVGDWVGLGWAQHPGKKSINWIVVAPTQGAPASLPMCVF